MILLTTKELADKCDVPFYTVQYLAKLGKLPTERKGKGDNLHYIQKMRLKSLISIRGNDENNRSEFW